MSSKLIIALDFNNQTDALKLVDEINPSDCALKIGSEMFTLFGPELVQMLIARDFRVFLDLKFHDIPNTVARACRAAADLGVWMMNVHASGGLAMMLAAKQSLDAFGKDRPLLIAVTVLTSMQSQDLAETGVNQTVLQQVGQLATLAKQAELDGVVCSAQEASLVKITCGQTFLTVTPGIRLPQSAQDDQARIITPEQALKSGSDFLVVGRPVTRAEKPQSVIQDILAHMHKSPTRKQ